MCQNDQSLILFFLSSSEEQQQCWALCNKFGCCGHPSSSLKDCINSFMQVNVIHICVSPIEWYLLNIFMTKNFFLLVFPSKPYNDVLHELEKGSNTRLTDWTNKDGEK